MSEIRPYYSTRQVIDVDTFLSERETSYIMCVTKAQLHALRVMAKTRLLWPTTWAKERYEQSYLLPDATDMDAIDAHISEWIADSEVIEMCNQNLVTALTDIAAAIRSSACCPDASAGLIEYEGETYYGTEQPLSEPTTFGTEEEFETEAEYLSHKCEAANAIVDGVIQTLNNLSLLSLASITAGAILLAIASPVISPIPLAVFLALAATGVAFGALHTLANAIDDNREDLVCLIYYSDTSISAYDVVHEFIHDLAVDLGWLEISITALDTFIAHMLPIDTFNHLYTAVGLPEVDVEVDCDACEEPCEWQVLWGSGTITTDGTSFTINSATNGSGYQEVTIIKTDACCPTNDSVEVVSWTGSPNNGFGIYQWNAADCPNKTRIVNNPSPIASTWSAMQASQTEVSFPFSVTFKITT